MDFSRESNTVGGGLTPSNTAWHAPLVVAGCLLAHGMFLARGFVWDDAVIRRHYHLTGQWRLLAPDPFGFVRPGKAFLFALMDTLFGDHAIVWQAACLLTLAATSLLVWRFARRYLAPGAALAAALIYGMHPFQVEATGWFSALNGTLMVALALIYYDRMLAAAHDPSGPRLAGLCLLFALALLMKEDALSVPLIGLLLLWFEKRCPGLRPPKGRDFDPQAGRRLIGAVVLQYGFALAYVLWSRRTSSSIGQELETLPYSDLLVSLHAPWMTVLHALYFVFPFRWAYYLHYLPGPAAFWTMMIVGWLFVGGLALIAWRRRDRLNPALLGLVLAVAAMAPVMNLLPMHNSWFGARYLVHGGVGFAIAAAWGLHRLWLIGSVARRATVLGLACWLAVAAAVSERSNWHWRADIPLFTRMVSTDQPLMHAFLANCLFNAGQYPQAEFHAREAIRAGHTRANPIVMLGMALARQGRMEEAVTEWRKAERKEPNNIDAAMNLGYYHDERHARTKDAEDLKLADQYYARAGRGLTENAEVALVNRGLLWVQRGDLLRGIEIWSEGQERFPGSADLARNLALARRQMAALARNPANTR